MTLFSSEKRADKLFTELQKESQWKENKISTAEGRQTEGIKIKAPVVQKAWPLLARVSSSFF